jgi:hypothetical protein
MVATAPSLARGGLGHYGITVRPRDLVREEFYITSGSRVVVIFYVYSGGSPSDIIFRIVAPDGREVYPRGRIEWVFEWSFTATQSGRYILEFDNTYSILSPKTIDLAISIEPPPTTVTVPTYIPTYITEYRTMTVPTYVVEYRTATVTVPAVLPGPSPESWLPLVAALAVGVVVGLPVGYALKRPRGKA